MINQIVLKFNCFNYRFVKLTRADWGVNEVLAVLLMAAKAKGGNLRKYNLIKLSNLNSSVRVPARWRRRPVRVRSAFGHYQLYRHIAQLAQCVRFLCRRILIKIF